MKYSFDNNTPIYIQISNKIRVDILSGKYKHGDKLPSVREFATTLKVNPNTIQKSLLDLENEGLIYTDRTNGKFIIDDQKLINKEKKIVANEIINNYFKDMKDIGFNENEAISFFNGKKGDE